MVIVIYEGANCVCFWFLAIDELMTPEEKAKLFTAIGYSDSSHHLSLPKQVSYLWDG